MPKSKTISILISLALLTGISLCFGGFYLVIHPLASSIIHLELDIAGNKLVVSSENIGLIIILIGAFMSLIISVLKPKDVIILENNSKSTFLKNLERNIPFISIVII